MPCFTHTFICQVPSIKSLVEEALVEQTETSEKQLVQLVVYNLPERDCSAKASDGEFHLSDDGLNKYKKYIDGEALPLCLPSVHPQFNLTSFRADIAAQLSTPEAADLQFTIVLEPDSLGNLVTNLSVEKCANAADAYREGISYVGPSDFSFMYCL